MHRGCLVRLPLPWRPSKLPIAILVIIPLFAEPRTASSITSRILIDPVGEYTGDEFGRANLGDRQQIRKIAWLGDRR